MHVVYRNNGHVLFGLESYRMIMGKCIFDYNYKLNVDNLELLIIERIFRIKFVY
jgi:hypothetical protein